MKPMTIEELVASIQHFWDTVSPEKLQCYIGHLRKVLQLWLNERGECQATDKLNMVLQLKRKSPHSA